MVASADVKRGSWWPDYRKGLGERAGQLKPAPTARGSRKHRASARAPGSYVPPAEGSVTAASGTGGSSRPTASCRAGPEALDGPPAGRDSRVARTRPPAGRPLLYGVGVPRGDGRFVVLMPGFLAGDQTLAVIAAWLRRIGYRTQLCGVLARCRSSDRTLDRLERRVEVVWRYYGRRVGLIGHKQWRPLRATLPYPRPDRVSHAISMVCKSSPGLAGSQRAHAVCGSASGGA